MLHRNITEMTARPKRRLMCVNTVENVKMLYEKSRKQGQMNR